MGLGIFLPRRVISFSVLDANNRSQRMKKVMYYHFFSIPKDRHFGHPTLGIRTRNKKLMLHHTCIFPPHKGSGWVQWVWAGRSSSRRGWAWSGPISAFAGARQAVFPSMTAALLPHQIPRHLVSPNHPCHDGDRDHGNENENGTET